jgi:hypothetical protein
MVENWVGGELWAVRVDEKPAKLCTSEQLLYV